jgi:hypothetical protein
LNTTTAFGFGPSHMEGLKRMVYEYTDGRGADSVIESVGHSDALGEHG